MSFQLVQGHDRFEYINASFLLSKFISYGCNFARDHGNVNLQAVDVVGYALRLVVGVIKYRDKSANYVHNFFILSVHDINLVSCINNFLFSSGAKQSMENLANYIYQSATSSLWCSVTVCNGCLYVVDAFIPNGLSDVRNTLIYVMTK